jgi:hypothetical protein
MQDRLPPSHRNPLASHGRTIQAGQTEKNSVRAYVFRFAPEVGHCAIQSACLKRAKLGHCGLFNQLVGASDQSGRYFEAERLRCFQVNRENELGGLFNRNVETSSRLPIPKPFPFTSELRESPSTASLDRVSS